MSNLKIIAVNDLDTSAVTTTATTPTSLGVDNLKLNSRSRVFRTTNTNDFSIYGNMDSSKLISGVSLARNNFSTDATYRVILYSGENRTGLVLYDSGFVNAVLRIGWGVFEWGAQSWGAAQSSGYSQITALWLSPVLARSFEIQVSDAGNEAGYIEIGRLFIGFAISPQFNLSFSHALEVVEDTKQYRTDGGTLRSEISLPYRSVNFSLPIITETDRQRLMTAFTKTGLRKDVLLSVFPDQNNAKEIDYTMVCKFTKIPKYVEIAPNYYKADFEFEEV